MRELGQGHFVAIFSRVLSNGYSGISIKLAGVGEHDLVGEFEGEG